MKFVITGGAGFIGSHIAKHLIEKNHDVIIVDNLSRGRLENLSKIKEQIEFKKMDILDFDSLKDVISNSDGIFHQAALTSIPESFLQKEKYYNVNVKGTENIFKLSNTESGKSLNSGGHLSQSISSPVCSTIRRYWSFVIPILSFAR